MLLNDTHIQTLSCALLLSDIRKVAFSWSQLEESCLGMGPGLCLKGNCLNSSADAGLSFGLEAQGFCLHFPGISSLSIPCQVHEISAWSEIAYEIYNVSLAIKSTRRLAAM